MERQADKNMNPHVSTIMVLEFFFSISRLIRRIEQEKILKNLET